MPTKMFSGEYNRTKVFEYIVRNSNISSEEIDKYRSFLEVSDVSSNASDNDENEVEHDVSSQSESTANESNEDVPIDENAEGGSMEKDMSCMTIEDEAVVDDDAGEKKKEHKVYPVDAFKATRFRAVAENSVTKHTPIFEGGKELKSYCIVCEKTLVSGQELGMVEMLDGRKRKKNPWWGCKSHFNASINNIMENEFELQVDCSKIINDGDTDSTMENVPEPVDANDGLVDGNSSHLNPDKGEQDQEKNVGNNKETVPDVDKNNEEPKEQRVKTRRRKLGGRRAKDALEGVVEVAGVNGSNALETKEEGNDINTPKSNGKKLGGKYGGSKTVEK